MFKVGDKVRIKLNLKTGRAYNGCYFISDMETYIGKTGIIIRVYQDDYQTRRYRLDIDENYYFSDDMLESINDFDSIFPYKVGDKVRIIDEMPENLCGISTSTWLQILGKSGKIVEKRVDGKSYRVSIPEILIPLWFPFGYLKKESIPTSENSTENISKLIECVPEIELSYCKKQIYTV